VSALGMPARASAERLLKGLVPASWDTRRNPENSPCVTSLLGGLGLSDLAGAPRSCWEYGTNLYCQQNPTTAKLEREEYYT